MGELRHKCVKHYPDLGPNLTETENFTDWHSWITNESNWKYDDDGLPVLCGNVTGSRHCPGGILLTKISHLIYHV